MGNNRLLQLVSEQRPWCHRCDQWVAPNMVAFYPEYGMRTHSGCGGEVTFEDKSPTKPADTREGE